jgi:hypothetical protein
VLRITVTETPTERKIIVEGLLVGPWVKELRTAWKRSNRSHNGRTCIVDLREVTLIDKSGQRVLRAMWKDGAQLVASGVYTKGVLAEVEGCA